MKKALWILLAGSMALAAVMIAFSDQTLSQEEPAAVAVDEISPLEGIWPPGEVREYGFHIAGHEIGRQWNQLLEGTGSSYDLMFRLKLDMSPVGQPIKMEMDGTLTLTPDGRPVTYDLNVSVDGQEQKLEVSFSDSTVEAAVQKAGGESRHSLPFHADSYVVDNNMIGQWGLMLGLLPLGAAEEIQQRIFVPQALTEMDVMIKVGEVETVSFGEEREEAYVCRILPLGEIYWVTKSGKLVRLEDQKQSLVVTLLPPGGVESPLDSSGDLFF